MLAARRCCGGSSYFLFKQSQAELSPIEDHGTHRRLGIRGPEGATSAYTDRLCEAGCEEIAMNVPEADRVLHGRWLPAVSQGRIILRLRPWWRAPTHAAGDRRNRSRPRWSRCRAWSPFQRNPPSARAGGTRQAGQRRRFRPRSPTQELQEMVDPMIELAEAVSRLADVDSDLKLNTPQLERAGRPRQGRRCWRRCESASAARSRRCSAAGRSRASSARASSTT